MSLFRRIRQPRLFLFYALVGACSFWLPDVLAHGFWRYSFDTKQVWLVTAASPLTLLAVYLLLLMRAERKGFRIHGVAMMTGVWLLGGIFMMISATFSGGGFSQFSLGVLLWTIATIIPVATCMMATYDGSLLALLIVTIGGLCVLCIRIWESRGRLPEKINVDEPA